MRARLKFTTDSVEEKQRQCQTSKAELTIKKKKGKRQRSANFSNNSLHLTAGGCAVIEVLCFSKVLFY